MREEIFERLQRIDRQINLIRNQKAKVVDGLNNLDYRLEQLGIEFNDLSNSLPLPEQGNRSIIQSAPPQFNPPQPVLTQETQFPEPEPIALESLDSAQAQAEPELQERGIPGAFLLETQRQAEERESVLGTQWLSRIGIVVLLLGISMALAYTFPHFSNGLKILTGFVVASILYGVGHWLYNQTSVLGRILQGGGLSVGYASLFAVFFIPQVQLINLPMLGVFSLFCYVAGMLFMAHRLNSQTVAILSTAFGYYTAPYAGDQGIQLVAAATLSLATVVVTRLHPEWRLMPKINWAGAIITYQSASFSRTLPTVVYQIYLVYTALLFHLVSLLRGQRGDLPLGQMNTLVFYLLFLATLPALKPNGLLEFMIAAVQLGSLWLVKKLDREADCKELAQGLLFNTLLMTGIATCRYFGGGAKSAVLAAEALGLAMLSAKSRYRPMMVAFSYFALFSAYIAVWGSWNTLSDPALFANALWVAGVSLCMEYKPFRHHSAPGGITLIVFAHLLIWTTVLKVSNENWRTLGIMLDGFSTLAAGFLLRRKRYRVTGLAIIFGFGGMSMLVDMIRLETIYKILLFILLGIGLLAGSYGYSRLSRHLEKEDVAAAE
jgi:hypothetical protein